MVRLALKVQYPLAIQKGYERSLESLVKAIYDILAREVLDNSQFITGYKHNVRRDGFNDDFQELISLCELKMVVELRGFVKKILSTAERVNLFNKKAVIESFKNTEKASSLGINLKSAVTQDMRAMWVSENVRLIKSIGQHSLKEVEQVVYSAIRQGVGHRELAKNLVERFAVAKKRASLIARDQIGKLSADLTRARHKELGITLYKWTTSRDERVRKSHQVLSDKICDYNDTDVYKNNVESKGWLDRASIAATNTQPGQDVLCRCTPLAIVPVSMGAYS
jgi:SPP1 gp7 family putative phage head morphogenesis protein